MTSKKQEMMFIQQHHTKRWTETPFTWAGKRSPTIISQDQVILRVDMHNMTMQEMCMNQATLLWKLLETGALDKMITTRMIIFGNLG